MNIKQHLWGYFFILPSLAFILVFSVYPLFYTGLLSLFEADMFSKVFVGIQNYTKLIHDQLFMQSFLNTFYYVLIIVPAVVLISLVIAAMMQGFNKVSQSMFRLVFYLPVVSTPVVLSLVWLWMYNPSFGIVTYFSSLLEAGPLDVFGSKTSAIFALSAVVVTWMVGQPIILYLSSMDGISKDLFEAAEMDGANWFQTFIKITLPMISHTTLLIVITSTINVFQIFVVIHLLTSGGPYHATESLVYTIYRTAFVSSEFGMASAQSIVLLFIISIIAVIQFKVLRTKD